MIRVALDTNILAYLAGVSRDARDDAKIVQARELVEQISETASLVVPTQAFGELFVVLRRSGAGADEARRILIEFSNSFSTPPSHIKTVLAASDLVVDHKFQFWDAMIVTAAVDAGCSLLLSEDMQTGFVTRGLTIINPLTDARHPKLADLIRP